jgi:hypothetical protein
MANGYASMILKVLPRLVSILAGDEHSLSPAILLRTAARENPWLL